MATQRRFGRPPRRRRFNRTHAGGDGILVALAEPEADEDVGLDALEGQPEPALRREAKAGGFAGESMSRWDAERPQARTRHRAHDRVAVTMIVAASFLNAAIWYAVLAAAGLALGACLAAAATVLVISVLGVGCLRRRGQAAPEAPPRLTVRRAARFRGRPLA